MTTEAAHTISSEGRKGIPVDLVGKRYVVKKPKSALGLRVAVASKKAGEDPEGMLNAMDSFIDMTFGKKDGVAIRKRLEDPDDDLDYEHITELVQALMEVDGNPTT